MNGRTHEEERSTLLRQWESLKHAYLFADTFPKRRVLAIQAANIAWALSENGGRFPTEDFLNDFLRASFEYERTNFQLDELHHIKQHMERDRELELDQAKVFYSKEFIKQLEKKEHP